MHGLRATIGRLLVTVRTLLRHDTLILSILAMVVGAAAGGAVILFREGISLAQTVFFGSGTERLSLYAVGQPWWRIVLAPAAGGLIVGLMVYFLMPGRRPQGIADCIEASALRGGRMSAKTGLFAAIIAATSIGAGASVGREGPAVHLGASLASWVSERLHLTRTLSRTLLGCGVAAAVAASFNAPMAGALFANEVVIGHYALSSFAPIVMASIVGTFVSQAHFGNYPAFTVPEHPVVTFWEFPAVMGLGVIAGLAAIAFMQSVRLAETAAHRLPGPTWLRPAVGGMIVGMIAVPLPQVLGIGYGVTETALTPTHSVTLLALICIAKVFATAVSLGFGFGGGVFSPSLVIGATLGGAYGAIAAGFFPDLSAGATIYTIVGMAAVAAAVLGAPISTTLIVFEMTLNYKLTMAVMLAVVVGTLVSRPLHGRSFFTWQLERRGLDLHGGFQTALLREIGVDAVKTHRCEVVDSTVSLGELKFMLQASHAGELFVLNDDGLLVGTVTLADLSESAFEHDLDDVVNAGDLARRKPPVLTVEDTLEVALKLMRTTGEPHIAVLDDLKTRQFAGCIHERDAMAAYNRALLDARREEQG